MKPVIISKGEKTQAEVEPLVSVEARIVGLVRRISQRCK